MPEIDLRWIGTSHYAVGATFGPYTSSGYEFVWIDRGEARLESDGCGYTLDTGTVALSRPGARNVYLWSTRRPTRHGYAIFTMSGDPGPRPPWPKVRQVADDDMVLASLRHVRHLAAERPAGWEDVARAALGYAVHAYATGATRIGRAPEPALPDPIEQSLLLVRRRWDAGRPLRAPGLDELARAAGVTPEHLCRVYRKEVGTGPVTALRLLRLGCGAALLGRSTMAVADVAAQTGFDNPFHFSRVFKQAFGTSPTEFRRTGHPRTNLPHALHRLAAHLDLSL